MTRLRERGHFLQPSSALEAVGELENLGSPIGAFLRDRCVVGADCDVATEELFRVWEDWCQEQRRERPGDKVTFVKNLRAAVSGKLTRYQRRLPKNEGGGQEWRYKGIRVKSPAELADLDPEDAEKVSGWFGHNAEEPM